MDYEVHLATLKSQPVAVVRSNVKREDIGEFLGGAFAEVMGVIGQQGLKPAGPPFGRYVPSDGGFQLEAGFPVDHPIEAVGRATPDELPGGTVAVTVHHGAYDAVGAAYEAATDWLGENGLVVSGRAWESYLDDPTVPQPRTEIFIPCQLTTAT